MPLAEPDLNRFFTSLRLNNGAISQLVLFENRERHIDVRCGFGAAENRENVSSAYAIRCPVQVPEKFVGVPVAGLLAENRFRTSLCVIDNRDSRAQMPRLHQARVIQQGIDHRKPEHVRHRTFDYRPE